jgi:hypothetical protein
MGKPEEITFRGPDTKKDSGSFNTALVNPTDSLTEGGSVSLDVYKHLPPDGGKLPPDGGKF